MKKIIYLICFAGIAMQACNEKTAGDNPLLAKFDTPFQVPPFEKIHNAHYLPAFREGIKQQQKEIEAIVTNSEAPTFANTIEALEKSGQLLDRVNYIFINLQEANTNDSLKAIAEEIMPELTAHNDGIYLNEQLFERVKKVYEAQEYFYKGSPFLRQKACSKIHLLLHKLPDYTKKLSLLPSFCCHPSSLYTSF